MPLSLRNLSTRFAFALISAFSLAQGQAQTAINVAAYGYRTPASTITAAPGQVITVSVFGLPARIPAPIFPIGGIDGLPTQVAGISVAFVQGPLTVQLGIRGVQQTPCPSSGPCSPATTLTIQIPYELNPESATQAVLNVQQSGGALEGGSTIDQLVINAVTDSVHVINTCDQTGIYLSVAVGVPASVCAPMVMHAHGPLVTASAPAAAGETLILWAYGLGALDHPPLSLCCSNPDQIPVAVQPLALDFSYFDPGRFPLHHFAQGIPSYAGMTGSGIYQLLLTVPAAPAGLSPCSASRGNLRILLSGPGSADAADICLQ